MTAAPQSIQPKIADVAPGPWRSISGDTHICDKNGMFVADVIQGISGTAVNSHASLTARVAELVTELRKLAIKASGGGHVNNGRSCAVCMGAWEDHAPEFHAVTCPLFDSAALDNADGGRGA